MTLNNPTPKADEKEVQNNPTPNVEDKQTASPTKNVEETKEEENLKEPFTDIKTIVISLSHNYSNYRRVNLKTLGHRTGVIGSCITSSKVLASNNEEMVKYFPRIIGVSPNNPDFVTKVKAWLNNIQFLVNENDVELNASFKYYHKEDYLRIKAKEDEIYDKLEKTDRSNIEVLRKAVNEFAKELSDLESIKYKYGEPIDVEQYLIYRHCLLYKDVAKDGALINSDPYIRFYIKNANKEKERKSKLVKLKMDAMTKFIRLNDSEEKFDAVYVAIIVALNENVVTALSKTKDEKQAVMINFVNENPDKFNKICNDPQVITKALINKLIARGELVKSDYNQQITTAEGTFIGANLNEAIAYFNSPTHESERNIYETKLKMF